MKHSDEHSADEATVEAGYEGHEVKRRNSQKYFAVFCSTSSIAASARGKIVKLKPLTKIYYMD